MLSWPSVNTRHIRVPSAFSLAALEQLFIHVTKSNLLKVAVGTPARSDTARKISAYWKTLLTKAGFAVVDAPERHLCCGSAGTYSLLQPELSQRLLQNKVTALHTHQSEKIVTANIGCLTHLQSGTETPVMHWVVLVEGLFV